MGKKRNRFIRKVDERVLRDRFLIVCQGKKTEPYYFRGFRLSKEFAKIDWASVTPLQLVDEAIYLWNKEKEDFDQVWCVFDRDIFTKNDFNGALSKAREYGIQVAYSNQAFELWFLLHFNYLDTGQDRNDLCKKLSKKIEGGYEKNNRNMYELLEPLQNDAIRNAKKLLKSHDGAHPIKCNPSTTVHLLVEELLKHAR